MMRSVANVRHSLRLNVLRGLFVGLIVGVIARLWMRWISTDPEFSWGGTLGIIIGFGIFGAVQSAVWNVVKTPHRKIQRTAIRILGGIFSLQLFAAAGASMFPTVLTCSLAIWRKSWSKWIRAILGVLGGGWFIFIINTSIITNFGFTFASLGRICLMSAIYCWIIWKLKSTVSVNK